MGFLVPYVNKERKPNVDLTHIPIAEDSKSAAGKSIRLPTHFQKQCIWIFLKGGTARLAEPKGTACVLRSAPLVPMAKVASK